MNWIKIYGLFFVLGGTPLGAVSTYPYAQQIKASAQRYGVEEALVRAVIKAESNFNPQARSHKGALGLMQLMPPTARQYEPNIAHFQLQEEPALNISIGTRHLKTLERQVKKRYPKAQGLDRVRLMAAAYNAGWGRVVAAGGGIPAIRETQEYVRRVTRYYQRYGGQFKPLPPALPAGMATPPTERIPGPVPAVTAFNAVAERIKVSTLLTLLFSAYGALAWFHLLIVRRRFAQAAYRQNL